MRLKFGPALEMRPTRWSTTLSSKVNLPYAPLGPYVVRTWSRYGRNFDPTKPAYSTFGILSRRFPAAEPARGSTAATVEFTDHCQLDTSGIAAQIWQLEAPAAALSTPSCFEALSSERGTCRRVRNRFGSWLSGKGPKNRIRCPLLSSAAVPALVGGSVPPPLPPRKWWPPPSLTR